ncbi:MAG: hypothetical protein MJD61_04015, partial [Proteobacteria bacterium]|nr:hypothetical protein [Pseudomonadota bacterium]
RNDVSPKASGQNNIATSISIHPVQRCCAAFEYREYSRDSAPCWPGASKPTWQCYFDPMPKTQNDTTVSG